MHKLVVNKDIQKLTKVWREKIKRAIEVRLTSAPGSYGKPLRRSLKGYRKLHVVDRSVIFCINGQIVNIFVIQHRSVVYKNFEKRVGK